MLKYFIYQGAVASAVSSPKSATLSILGDYDDGY